MLFFTYTRAAARTPPRSCSAGARTKSQRVKLGDLGAKVALRRVPRWRRPGNLLLSGKQPGLQGIVAVDRRGDCIPTISPARLAFMMMSMDSGLVRPYTHGVPAIGLEGIAPPMTVTAKGSARRGEQ